jgi:predicted nicotinamide N-methyase
MNEGSASVRFHEVAGLRLAAPTDAERLRDGFGRPPGERRLPYWARLWPSGVVLARLIAGELRDRIADRTVVEIGCGLGAAGIVAGRVGGRVILTDSEPEAVAVAAENARRNGVDLGSLCMPWDRIPDAAAGWFDVVLASDVVYDRDQLAPLAGAIATLLRPGGEAWVADPARLGIRALLVAAERAGLDGELVRTEPHPDGVVVDYAEVRDVHVYRFTRR